MMILKSIAINQITFDDDLFALISPQKPIDWERDSQLFNPVWLQETSPNTYRIIDGFLVLDAIRNSNSQTTIPACIFSKDEDLVDIWKNRIRKRNSEQNLSILEILESMVKILDYLKLNQLPPKMASLCESLGIGTKNLNVQSLLYDIAKLKQTCTFADLYSLNYKDIIALARRKKEELTGLSRIIGDLKLKGNKLGSLLQMFDELAKGYGWSVQDLTNDSRLIAVLEKTPVHQRYKQLKAFLYTLRWPTLNATADDWSKTLKKLDLPLQITIDADPFFEADEIKITIKTSSIKDCKHSLDVLQKKADEKTFIHLFDFV